MLSGDHDSDMQSACFDASIHTEKAGIRQLPRTSVQHYKAAGKLAGKLKAPKALAAVRPKIE
jgi:hypothetical protein